MCRNITLWAATCMPTSLSTLVASSRAVAETASRLGKINHLAALLTQVAPDELRVAIAYLSGATPQGRIGIGGAAIREARDVPPADAPSLTLSEVDDAFADVAASSGPGSTRRRAERLRQLLSRATDHEQDFLVRLLFGELRQGALEGVLVDAVARAAGVPAARVRRAAMLAGDLAPVATALRTGGAAALDAFGLRVLQPVQPMLADAAGDVTEALSSLGDAALEYKLDGARIQVHKAGEEVLRVLARAASRDTGRARSRRGRAGDASPFADPRRRGAGAQARRHATRVPGHDAALRASPRRGVAARGIAADAGLLRRVARRGRRLAGSAAARALRGAVLRWPRGPW